MDFSYKKLKEMLIACIVDSFNFYHHLVTHKTKPKTVLFQKVLIFTEELAFFFHNNSLQA